MNKNQVDKKWFQTEDTKIAPPPEVETAHYSKPFLVKTLGELQHSKATTFFQVWNDSTSCIKSMKLKMAKN